MAFLWPIPVTGETTGTSWPWPAGADLLLAEATYPERVPKDSVGLLSSARRAGEHASAAEVAQLVLTHLWPGTDSDTAERAARQAFDGPIAVARPGLQIDLP